MSETQTDDRVSMHALTATIVSAYVSNNPVPAGELPNVIASIHAALLKLETGGPAEAEQAMEKVSPAQIRKSITPEALISFEDGKPYKTLRRHLTIRGLSPEAYRAKWGLPKDYPMTCPDYSAQRSALARSLGLGRPGRMAKDQPEEGAGREGETPRRQSQARRKEAEAAAA